jgi:hypothetical protein
MTYGSPVFSDQRLGCFPDLVEVPNSVVEHVRGCLGLVAGVELVCESPRTAERHREWVRQRLGVVYDPPAVRKFG